MGEPCFRNPVTFQTGEPDVFAGGDSLTGPRFAIDAIAQGKEGAISIHRYVHPGQSLTLGRIKRDYLSFDKDDLALDGYDRMPRQSLHHIHGNESKKTFRDLRETFTEEQVRIETERCLGCGAAVVDSYLCVGCGACTLKCKFDAISLKKKYDCKGVDLLELRPIVMKNAIKRQFRIIAKKPFRLIDSTFPKKQEQ
jgi:ferredoxin